MTRDEDENSKPFRKIETSETEAAKTYCSAPQVWTLVGEDPDFWAFKPSIKAQAWQSN